MTRALFDVNVLLALLDSDHVHHEVARRWLTREQEPDWASCAITQNGFVRILSQPTYPNPVTVAAACETLAAACAAPHHNFWPCDTSLLDATIDHDRLLSSRAVTDIYLLGLAVRHGGRLVTFDRHISAASVTGATDDHLVAL